MPETPKPSANERVVAVSTVSPIVRLGPFGNLGFFWGVYPRGFQGETSASFIGPVFLAVVHTPCGEHAWFSQKDHHFKAVFPEPIRIERDDPTAYTLYFSGSVMYGSGSVYVSLFTNAGVPAFSVQGQGTPDAPESLTIHASIEATAEADEERGTKYVAVFVVNGIARKKEFYSQDPVSILGFSMRSGFNSKSVYRYREGSYPAGTFIPTGRLLRGEATGSPCFVANPQRQIVKFISLQQNGIALTPGIGFYSSRKAGHYTFTGGGQAGLDDIRSIDDDPDPPFRLQPPESPDLPPPPDLPDLDQDPLPDLSLNFDANFDLDTGIQTEDIIPNDFSNFLDPNFLSAFRGGAQYFFQFGPEVRRGFFKTVLDIFFSQENFRKQFSYFPFDNYLDEPHYTIGQDTYPDFQADEDASTLQRIFNYLGGEPVVDFINKRLVLRSFSKPRIFELQDVINVERNPLNVSDFYSELVFDEGLKVKLPNAGGSLDLGLRDFKKRDPRNGERAFKNREALVENYSRYLGLQRFEFRITLPVTERHLSIENTDIVKISESLVSSGKLFGEVKIGEKIGVESSKSFDYTVQIYGKKVFLKRGTMVLFGQST